MFENILLFMLKNWIGRLITISLLVCIFYGVMIFNNVIIAK